VHLAWAKWRYNRNHCRWCYQWPRHGGWEWRSCKRDSSRRFRGTWCKPYPGIVDPLTSEALALRDVVVFARGLSFSRILVETDCSQLVRLWENKGTDRSLIGPLLQEISSLSLEFQPFLLFLLVGQQTILPMSVHVMHVCTTWQESGSSRSLFSFKTAFALIVTVLL
jgi:hypothetical protein